MQNYIVRVYRAHNEDMWSVSGVIEDIEPCQQESFHSINELQAMLALSIGKGQPVFPNFAIQVLNTHDNVAVVGWRLRINNKILAV